MCLFDVIRRELLPLNLMCLFNRFPHLQVSVFRCLIMILIFSLLLEKGFVFVLNTLLLITCVKNLCLLRLGFFPPLYLLFLFHAVYPKPYLNLCEEKQ